MLHEIQSASRLNAEVGIEAEYDFLSDEYREFYQPGRATAFQAPLWMDMVHRRLAHGLNATQRTLTVRAKDGRLIALAPFVLQRMKGIRILAPADFGVCDYNSLVGDRDTLAALAGEPALVEAIHREVRRNCDVLMFRKVRVDDFDVGRLFPGSKSSAAENAAYHSEIGEDFEEWQRRTIRRKFSKELGRLQRQAEREFGSYEHRPAQDETEIRQVFDRLTEWRGGRFAGDLLQNPLYFDFYRDYAIAGLTGGDAITYVSYAAGQPAAVLFGPSGDGEFHAVIIGADTENFSRQSPGIQLIYQTIKRRFHEGFREFDMGLGNTGYKSHFRVLETPLLNHTKSFTFAGSAVAMIYHRAKPVKNFLRNYVPHVR